MRVLQTCFLFLFAALSLNGQPQNDQTREVVKQDSRIEFHSSSTFGKTVGVFHSWDADLKMPTDNFADASLSLEIETASVDTGSGLKDKEARGKNFFSVKEYPKIRFVMKSVAPDVDPAKLHLAADLTMRGITKPVSVAIFLHPSENGVQRIEGDFSFDRRDFGMTHNLLFDKIANTVLVKFQLVVKNRS
jgi:polyisoprenoid-binding protein YceI